MGAGFGIDTRAPVALTATAGAAAVRLSPRGVGDAQGQPRVSRSAQRRDTERSRWRRARRPRFLLRLVLVRVMGPVCCGA